MNNKTELSDLLLKYGDYYKIPEVEKNFDIRLEAFLDNIIDFKNTPLELLSKEIPKFREDLISKRDELLQLKKSLPLEIEKAWKNYHEIIASPEDDDDTSYLDVLQSIWNMDDKLRNIPSEEQKLKYDIYRWITILEKDIYDYNECTKLRKIEKSKTEILQLEIAIADSEAFISDMKKEIMSIETELHVDI